jgi:predicted NAD/FAD-binding protein
VWSTGPGSALDYPARYLFRFLDHHGMLQVTGSPQWYTVVGGSRTYVDAIAAALPDVRQGSPVVSVRREPDQVVVQDASGRANHHDRVVLATHADTALDLLADPTPEEKEVLGAFGYTRNEVILHTDERLLPRAPRARSSWNYLSPAHTQDRERPPVVTYWMNRLQGLHSREPWLVTLNAPDRVREDRVVASMSYEHPLYDLEAVQAQRRLPSLNTATTAFAGAYHGWGFHEDGCRSGVAAAHAFGAVW